VEISTDPFRISIFRIHCFPKTINTVADWKTGIEASVVVVIPCGD